MYKLDLVNRRKEIMDRNIKKCDEHGQIIAALCTVMEQNELILDILQDQCKEL